MAESYPTLNGEAQSWTNIRVAITPYDGTELDAADLSDISWSGTIEVGEQRMTGGRLKARTAGMPKCEAKATFYADGYDRLIDALAKVAIAKGFVNAAGAARIALVKFDVLIMHTPIDQSTIKSVLLEGCRLLTDSASMSEGTDADKLEVSLNPVEVTRTTTTGQKVVLL